MLLNPEARKEIDKALDHLDTAMMFLQGEHILKYNIHSSMYDFIYKFNPEVETIYGKMWAMSDALMNIYCDYQPDPADDKSWREEPYQENE